MLIEWHFNRYIIACIHHGENVICLNRFIYFFFVSAIFCALSHSDCLRTDCVRLNGISHLHNFLLLLLYGSLNSWHFYCAFLVLDVVLVLQNMCCRFNFARTHHTHALQLKYQTTKKIFDNFAIFADLHLGFVLST